MFENIMCKLTKLDIIDNRMQAMENELREVKQSLEFAHAEVQEMKSVNAELKKSEDEMKKRIVNLEQQNSVLNNRVIDIQARSMRDKLIFYNLPERREI